MSNSLQPHGLYSLWNSTGQNTGVGIPSPGALPNPGTEPRLPALQAASLLTEPPGKSMHTGVGSPSLLQGAFPTQELNQGLLQCRQILFFFNWRLITLQYCGGFCHTLTWISHRCTCVPHPEPHPSGLSQNTSFECPASRIKLALVI